ncbi:MAG: MBL fold metallo-hydrolase [Clostridiales bacterium]|nr:MBL fold metallo-hydrolase [Roseburia sp.]MDD7637486.1 MBL fold metallo-hydrolase [Clostridiales bacterium]MDY4113962.1 MBL fold metallo-hydrolase [Roseburia sp.]
MEPLRVEQYVVGMVQTNCYFAINDNTKEALIVDPGASASKLAEIIEEEKLNPVAILLTHGHFDHAGGAEELADRYGIQIYAHEAERETLENPAINLSGWEGKERAYRADCYLKDEQEIDLAGFHIRVFHTPGHTVGGCCYFLPYQNVVFCGDTLFAQSVGRTDFPKGSASELIRSIKEKLMTLPEDVTVYPGHNEITTIGTERMYNPYL